MPSFDFPRSVRIVAATDFVRIRAQGRRVSSQYFIAQCCPAESARLGLAISRRAAKRALDRNRLKRILRESFRLGRALLPNLDIVIAARASANDQASAALRADLEALWQRLRGLV